MALFEAFQFPPQIANSLYKGVGVVKRHLRWLAQSAALRFSMLY